MTIYVENVEKKPNDTTAFLTSRGKTIGYFRKFWKIYGIEKTEVKIFKIYRYNSINTSETTTPMKMYRIFWKPFNFNIFNKIILKIRHIIRLIFKYW